MNSFFLCLVERFVTSSIIHAECASAFLRTSCFTCQVNDTFCRIDDWSFLTTSSFACQVDGFGGIHDWIVFLFFEMLFDFKFRQFIPIYNHTLV